MKHLITGTLAVVFLSACSTPKQKPTDDSRQPLEESYFQYMGNSMMIPVVGEKGMVVADDQIAADWGAEILRRGGNAMDAAVATLFAMSVTRPQFASLGGGGFMVYCPSPAAGLKMPCYAIDFREQAPMASFRDLYIRDGKARTDLSQDGALASGTPGITAGLLLVLKEFGTLDRQKLMTYPIRLANRGIRVSGGTEYALGVRWKAMNPAAQKIFSCGNKDKTHCRAGQKLKQKDLAGVLRAISEKGTAGFYKGWVAKKISDGLQKAGGIMTTEDLEKYQAKIRKPVSGGFAGYEVVSMSPPSAGGTNIVQMLKLTEHAAKEGLLDGKAGQSGSVHAMAHAMSIAFSDRAEYFGDPDQVHVPVAEMIRPQYLLERWKKTFKKSRANSPKGPGKFKSLVAKKESDQTTHLSVIDASGNAVSVTVTVNAYFGSGFVPDGTGVVMNNEMDDFSIQPGVKNYYGLIGNEANAVAPLKRPLSSMSPTIVRDMDGHNRLVLGAEGGPRITTSVYQTIVNRFLFNRTLPDAVATPRFHHQWRPDVLLMETIGFSNQQYDQMNSMGYKVKPYKTYMGRIHALERFRSGKVWGVADSRGEGSAVAE